MWILDGPERNHPPKEFQDRLMHLGGLNRYDEPNFKIAWAQYETYWAGGAWSVDEEYFLGYRQLLSGSGEPCWSLYQWHAPEEYGTPESYYVSNIDPDTGLQILGEYPYSGRYEVLYNLRWHEQDGGRLTFHTMPLNTTTFDTIIPVILAARDVSVEKRRAAYEEQRAREEAEKVGKIEQHLKELALPFRGAVSYSRQGIRSTVIDKKTLDLQRTWAEAQKNARQFKLGLQTK